MYVSVRVLKVRERTRRYGNTATDCRLFHYELLSQVVCGLDESQERRTR